jgi:hypothetical protein
MRSWKVQQHRQVHFGKARLHRIAKCDVDHDAHAGAAERSIHLDAQPAMPKFLPNAVNRDAAGVEHDPVIEPHCADSLEGTNHLGWVIISEAEEDRGLVSVAAGLQTI